MSYLKRKKAQKAVKNVLPTLPVNYRWRWRYYKTEPGRIYLEVVHKARVVDWAWLTMSDTIDPVDVKICSDWIVRRNQNWK